MTLDFGVISDVGLTDDTNADEHTIMFAFRACVLDSHSSVSAPSTMSIAAGVKLGEYTVWVGELDVDLVETVAPVAEASSFLLITNNATFAF